jgi:DNA-binding GntR family transcriptional regulator
VAVVDKDEECKDSKQKKSKSTFKEQAYEKMKNAILFNHFRIGAIYSQESICKDLNISLTPLREAMLELQNEGYVSYCRGKGVLIKPVSREEARNILQARLWIEKLTAGVAAQKATAQDIEEMRKRIDELQEKLETRDAQNLYRIDHGFHKAIAYSTHNPYIYRFCCSLLDHYLRFEVKSVYSNSIDARHVFEEHFNIFKCIEAHKATKAEEMMVKHLNNSFQRTLSMYWSEHQ